MNSTHIILCLYDARHRLLDTVGYNYLQIFTLLPSELLVWTYSRQYETTVRYSLFDASPLPVDTYAE